MPRKVLLISYHFPPSTEVGGLRIANFAKKLSRFGWESYVLTVKDKYLQSLDTTKLDYAGDANVFKAGQTPTLSQVYLALKKTGSTLFGRDASSAATRASSPPSQKKAGSGTESLGKRVRRYILSFLSLPDTQRNWLLPALILAVRVVRREKIHCIVTSCPPYTVHLVGLLTRWITGVKWVADFRDPWMTAGSKSLYATCSASLWIERRLERRVLESADLVVANTQVLCQAFKKAHGSIPATRFVWIPNGYDRDFLSLFENIPKDPTFSIVYTGSLYFGRTPEPLFRALQELFSEGVMQPQSIRVRLVGHCRSVDGRPMDRVVDGYGLGNVVDVLDPVPYNRALEMIKRSHLALLLAPDQPYQIPAKVYDYMGLGTRVLALAGEGSTAALIRDTNIGAVFDPSDIGGIKGFIRTCLDEQKTSTEWRQSRGVNGFDLDSVAGRLADGLDFLYNAEEAEALSPRSPDPPG